MFSRSVAGIAENSLLLGVPGSTKGSVESINAVFPTILHLFEVLKGSKHS
jgi:molybdopterin biosynthesis enzyme MoaB